MVLGLIAAACSDDDDSSDTTEAAAPAATDAAAEEPADTAAEEPTDTAAAATGEAFRVALIYPGTSDDLSWSNAWFEGAQEAIAENPNIEVESVELINDPDTALAQGSAFASEGFDLILYAHGAMVDPAITLAQEYPDTQICLAPHHPGEETGPPTQPDNLCWVDVAQHDADFLAGALAALATETGHIGSLNGFEFPALTRQPESFVLGARCVNPDIEFSQEYMNTWTDTGIAKAAAQSLAASGVDVILSATDSAVFGIIDAANEADTQVWVVPSYYESKVLGEDVVLTSAIHGLSLASRNTILQAVNGEIGPADFIEYDATNNDRIQAPVYDDIAALLSAEDLALYEEIEAKVRSGEITIPDETSGDVTIGTQGSGSEIDVAVIGCA
jgi:basic membrane protein A